jgi:hypothetical protein
MIGLLFALSAYSVIVVSVSESLAENGIGGGCTGEACEVKILSFSEVLGHIGLGMLFFEGNAVVINI